MCAMRHFTSVAERMVEEQRSRNLAFHTREISHTTNNDILLSTYILDFSALDT